MSIGFNMAAAQGNSLNADLGNVGGKRAVGGIKGGFKRMSRSTSNAFKL